MEHEWQACMQALLSNPKVSGCAVMSTTGDVVFGAGALSNAADLPDTELVLNFFQHQESEMGSEISEHRKMDAFQVLGLQLVPFYQSKTSVFATSKYKRHTLVINKLPFGYLLSLSQKPHLPSAAITDIEKIAETFRN
mmetsp:Transcript_39283/g.77266  ORF Transcript_39283/g.77266 Transcript_39283/m.77266 type:complete len:138 (-) Transcript_39283:69-482(-)